MLYKLDNRFFPLIFNSITHGIFTVDADGFITSFNRRAEELTGYKREEAIGEPCYRIFQADICREDCPLEKSVRTGARTEDREVNVLTREGNKLHISISTAALKDENGKVLGGVEMFRDISILKELRKKLDSSYIVEDIVSKNPAMHKVFDMLPLIADSQSNVLIIGESGTGKELVARAIHNMGPRKDHPFVAINCSAFPDNLFESELFGYLKGAFTDAVKDKPGRFALAERGTLLLDEVAELSPAMQVKLLRVLQEKEYEPLGATKPVKADVRIMSATNKDLSKEVQEGKFRQDLFFRLNVVNITLPPLRDRQEDIPILVKHFIEKFNTLQGRRIKRCTEKALSALIRFPYTGNIRELENAIEHAFVVSAGEIIQLADLPQHIAEYEIKSSISENGNSLPLEDAEAETIKKVLIKNKWVRKNAALELGISRNTLWRKMKKYNLI